MTRGGSTRAWRTLRAQVLKEEPLCQIQTPGICTRISTTADHRLPVNHYPQLEYDRANLQGACAPCNLSKGAQHMYEQPPQRALSFFM